MPAEALQPEPQQPDELTLVERDRAFKNIVKYDAVVGNEVVGSVDVNYAKRLGAVTLDAVSLVEESPSGRPIRGRGYGHQLYAHIPNLPLPDGSDFRESGMRFMSSPMLTDGEQIGTGRGMWQALVRRGKAVQLDDGRFEYIVPPRNSQAGS
jgi:hypothetical protein